MQAEQIRDFRASLRNMVRELGMLNKKCNGSELSPLQSHILIELDKQHQGVTELATRLCVEKASISRTLRSMEKMALVTRIADRKDGRASLFMLTETGNTVLAEINLSADQFIEQALVLSSEQEQQVLTNTITRFNSALKNARRQRDLNIVIRPIESRDDAQMAEIVRNSFRENKIDHLEGVSLHDPELNCLSATYAQKGCGYWVVESDGEILGGVGLAPFVVDGTKAETEYCEMQKLFLASGTQGTGLGRRLISLVLSKATELGYRYCYLETLNELASAVSLYESFGFERLQNRLGNSGHGGCEIWMVKKLS